MSLRLPLVLVGILALTGCETSTAQTPATSSARAPTAPPAVPASITIVPTEENLITDPSLENTAPGERYPPSWGTGYLIPPNAYQHQVVEGGRTGQRGWIIEGDGQYAVVPTNRPQVDRANRYAARGWVRLEAGSAQLKMLYFDGTVATSVRIAAPSP